MKMLLEKFYGNSFVFRFVYGIGKVVNIVGRRTYHSAYFRDTPYKQFFQGEKLQRFYRNLSVLVGLNLQEGNCMGFPHRCMYVKLFCMGRESTMAAFNPSLVKVIKIMTAFENTVQFRENRVQWCSISHKSKSPPSSKFYSRCLCPSSRHFLWITKIDFSTEFHQQK